MMAKKTSKKRKSNQAAAEVFVTSLVTRYTNVEQDVKTKVAEACISGFEEIVYGTPVLTGYAASEWQVFGAGAKGTGLHVGAAKDKKFTGELSGIIATNKMKSVIPNDSSTYFEKIGSATIPKGPYFTPSHAVKEGARKIMGFMRVGDNGKPQKFNFVNHAPYIGVLENSSYSMQGQGFIKRGTMKIAAKLASARIASGQKKIGKGSFKTEYRGSSKLKGNLKDFKAWITQWI